MDKARLDSLQESEETMNEMRNVYEREKLMLMEENKKLQVGVSFKLHFFCFSVKYRVVMELSSMNLVPTVPRIFWNCT